VTSLSYYKYRLSCDIFNLCVSEDDYRLYLLTDAIFSSVSFAPGAVVIERVEDRGSRDKACLYLLTVDPVTSKQADPKPVMEAAAPALDLESSPVQGQLASAVLDLQGHIVRGQLSPHDASILFQMLVETGNLQGMDGFRRITVTYSSVRYVVARDDSHVYVVQTRNVS